MHVLIIGFGEAGRAFSLGWHGGDAALTLTAHDRAQDGTRRTEFEAAARDRDVALVAHGAASFAAADLVVSLVTADQALAVAREAAPHMKAGQMFLDFNSVAPSTKRAAAQIVRAGGADYLDVGVLGPVHPHLNRVPVALAGPDGEARARLAATLDLVVSHEYDEIGRAAELKLLRSIVIKGVEGVVAEALAACDAADMRDTVLASLAPSFPGIDWPRRAAYIEERITAHGARRAAEMVEASRMLRDMGLDPMVSEGVARRIAEAQARTPSS